MSRKSLPTRTLPDCPELDQLRRQAKELCEGASADPVEADAEPWATPKAWAEKKGIRRYSNC